MDFYQFKVHQKIRKIFKKFDCSVYNYKKMLEGEEKFKRWIDGVARSALNLEVYVFSKN